MKQLVFVYGTLKNGYRNAYFLDNSKFITKTRTADAQFNMREMGSYDIPNNSYPATTAGGNATIVGELYEVDDTTLAELDELEELGIRYERKIISLACDKQAWIYLHIDPTEPPVESRQVTYCPADNEFCWTEFQY